MNLIRRLNFTAVCGQRLFASPPPTIQTTHSLMLETNCFDLCTIGSLQTGCVTTGRVTGDKLGAFNLATPAAAEEMFRTGNISDILP